MSDGRPVHARPPWWLMVVTAAFAVHCALIALELPAGSEALEHAPGAAPPLDRLLPSPALRQALANALAPDPLDRPAASVDELLESVERALMTPGEPA